MLGDTPNGRVLGPAADRDERDIQDAEGEGEESPGAPVGPEPSGETDPDRHVEQGNERRRQELF